MIEAAIAILLQNDSIKGLVGGRYAIGQLLQGTTYPALVYQVIDCYPDDPVDYATGGKLRARVQFNPLARSLGGVKEIQSALLAELDYLHGATAGEIKIISSRLASLGPADRDTVTGVWTQPVDFSILFYRST